MPRSTTRRGTSLPALALLVAVGLLVGGCGSGGGGDRLPAGGVGDGGSGGPASSAAGPAAGPAAGAGSGTGTADADTDERVIEDYRKHWEDVVAARAAGDPFLARLTNHAIDPRLSTVTLEIRDDKAAGKVTKGEPKVLSVDVRSREGGRARVASCVDANTWRYHSAKTGEPLEAFSKKRYNVVATLLLRQTTWKVASLDIQEDSCDG